MWNNILCPRWIFRRGCPINLPRWATGFSSCHILVFKRNVLMYYFIWCWKLIIHHSLQSTGSDRIFVNIVRSPQFWKCENSGNSWFFSNFHFTVLLITLLLPILQAWNPEQNQMKSFFNCWNNMVKILLLSGFPRLGCHGSVQRIPWQENVSGPDQGLAERASVQGMQSNLHRRADGLRPRNEKQVEYLITLLFEQLV